MTIKYRDSEGKIHEVEGEELVCQDKHGKDVYAGDRANYYGPGDPLHKRTPREVDVRFSTVLYVHHDTLGVINSSPVTASDIELIPDPEAEDGKK